MNCPLCKEAVVITSNYDYQLRDHLYRHYIHIPPALAVAVQYGEDEDYVNSGTAVSRSRRDADITAYLWVCIILGISILVSWLKACRPGHGVGGGMKGMIPVPRYESPIFVSLFPFPNFHSLIVNKNFRHCRTPRNVWLTWRSSRPTRRTNRR